ncbi:MAG: hypothetical protein IJ903_03360 [Ruminococcus sp.]|nr:hypothetical protein [Ruminococcus sp.]
MKKVLLIVTVLFVLTSLCSCAENKPDVKTSKPKADKSDYQKYVSDYNKGYPVSFCGMKPAIKKNKKARVYYKSNVREKNGFLITDYKDGICINKVLEPETWDYKIPEKIENKPVVKLGCYLDKKDKVKPFIAFYSEGAKEISLPKTIHYIDKPDLYNSKNRIYYKIDKSSPYYATDRNYEYLFAKKNGYIDAVTENFDWFDQNTVGTDFKTVKKSSEKYKKLGKDYEKISGYEEYISDRDKGVFTSFCGLYEYNDKQSIKKAREYYKNNSRKSGNFIITNYLDGICINKVIDVKNWDYKIPEKIEGLPVIKLGSYFDKDNFLQPAIYLGIEVKKQTVYLPKTLKYIDFDCLDWLWNSVFYSVDKDNPYYANSSTEYECFFALEDGFVQYAYFNNDSM